MADWQHRAACRDTDPELFFPIGNTGPALLQIKDAKDVCHRCAVIGECLLWAVATDVEDGVWGGQDQDERHREKRRQRYHAQASQEVPEQLRAAALAEFAERRLQYSSDMGVARAVSYRCAGITPSMVIHWAAEAGYEIDDRSTRGARAAAA